MMQGRLRVVVAPRLRVVVVVVLMEATQSVLVAVPCPWWLAVALLELAFTRSWLQRRAAWVYGPSRR